MAQPSEKTSSSGLYEKEYLFEVIRHLYRWYLDEKDIESIVGSLEIEFWVRQRKPKLDPGDKSLFGEIVIPSLNIRVTVKKPDYTIEELNLPVKDNTFKIINVARNRLPSDSSGYKIITASYKAILDYTTRTRSLARFPEEDLLIRLRLCAHQKIVEYFENRLEAGLENEQDLLEVKAQNQLIYLSPFPEVANEVWAFWENGRMLIRFSSDIDLENPAFWEHDELAVDLYDIDEQTVVSLEEVAGSNAYMTRDQVGRALFNCIILGRRQVLEPLEESQ